MRTNPRLFQRVDGALHKLAHDSARAAIQQVVNIGLRIALRVSQHTQPLIVGEVQIIERLADDFCIDPLNVADDFRHAKSVKPVRQNVRRPRCNRHMRHFLVAQYFVTKSDDLPSLCDSVAIEINQDIFFFQPTLSHRAVSAQLVRCISSRAAQCAIHCFVLRLGRSHIFCVNVIAHFSHIRERAAGDVRHIWAFIQQDRVMAAADQQLIRRNRADFYFAFCLYRLDLHVIDGAHRHDIAHLVFKRLFALVFLDYFGIWICCQPHGQLHFIHAAVSLKRRSALFLPPPFQATCFHQQAVFCGGIQRHEAVILLVENVITGVRCLRCGLLVLFAYRIKLHGLVRRHEHV